MLVIPTLQNDGTLSLASYSFSADELDSVEQTLNRAGIRFSLLQIPSDAKGRNGRNYVVRKDDVPRLERSLNLEFQSFRGRTTVVFADGGIPFHCKELDPSGIEGTGCVNMAARDYPEARLKCGLIASKKGWLGGVASPGECSQ